ncbi:MAG: glutamyl-tRNA reductase [Bryobacteraceae bacterium]|nr:glutamyl-tRNA reductase [Bryobacteraceae bacterium]
MKLVLTGLNHRTAPVSVRERLAFSEQELPAALRELFETPGVSEAMILSTCNRVEVLVAMDDSFDGPGEMAGFLCRTRELDRSWLEPHLYALEGTEAVKHVFRVAASLDSMVVGEPQILGQLKAAYAMARENGTLTGLLDTVLTRAFGVAKRVRTETEIGASAVSISYAAVELAREIFGNLKKKRVMLIGAGKMSELAARHLHRSGAEIRVTNRTESRAVTLAELVGGTVVPYESYKSQLRDIDIVITSSGATEFLLRRDEVKRIIDARKNRPMFLIDIAVPRNIEPSVNEIDNIFLYDIDDLQRVVSENLKTRLSEAEDAGRIVGEEVERLEAWMRTRAVGPVIVDLQESLERLRAGEVERMRGKLGPLTPQQEQAVEQLTRGIINKIAHGPIAALRRNAGDETVVERIRSIFRLDEDHEPTIRAKGK